MSPRQGGPKKKKAKKKQPEQAVVDSLFMFFEEMDQRGSGAGSQKGSGNKK